MAPDNTSREHNTIRKGLQHLYGKHQVLHSNKVQGKKKTPTTSTEKQAGLVEIRRCFPELCCLVIALVDLGIFFKAFGAALCLKQRNIPGWRLLSSPSSLAGNSLEPQGQSTSNPSDSIHRAVRNMFALRTLSWSHHKMHNPLNANFAGFFPRHTTSGKIGFW